MRNDQMSKGEEGIKEEGGGAAIVTSTLLCEWLLLADFRLLSTARVGIRR